MHRARGANARRRKDRSAVSSQVSARTEREEGVRTVTSLVPPVQVSRLLLLGLVAAGALAAVVTSQPTSSFAGGFAAGAGAVFIVSFLSNPRRDRTGPDDGESP